MPHRFPALAPQTPTKSWPRALTALPLAELWLFALMGFLLLA